MAPGAAEQPSEPQAAALGLLREITTDALRYWEVRRILYNALLAAIVVAHFVAAWPASKAVLTGDTRLLVFLLAVMANVAYCAAYIADVFIQLSGFRAQRRRWRLALLVVGCAFAAVLTHFMSMGLFAKPGA
jgi:drug/metabolite transporter (DMT)-like permease